MASERTNDPILDLLFEELDSDERDALRAEIEGDPAQAEELESFEHLLGRVRDADLVEDVPSSVHDAIMEAARAGAPRATGGRRAPRRAPSSEQGSLWSRMTGGPGQIALVATVLLAGAFVFRFVEQGPAPYGDSAEAPITEMMPATEELPAEGEARGKADSAESELQLELAEAEEADRNEAAVADNAREDSLLDGLAAKPEEESLPGARDIAETASPIERAKRRSRSTKAAPSPAPRPTAKKSKGSDKALGSVDLFGGEASPSSSNAGPAQSGSGITTTTRETEQKPRSKVDYLQMDDLDDAPADEAAAPAAAEPEADMEEERAAYEPPTGTPASIQQTFDSRDYSRTVAEANDYLSGESGNATDRATVMQLKAQSLFNLGRLTEADRIYASIQRSYPNFRPDQIAQARAEIGRRSDAKRKRKPKASPKKQESIDFSDDQIQMEPSSAY
jgi:hypothetical protein